MLMALTPLGPAASLGTCRNLVNHSVGMTDLR